MHFQHLSIKSIPQKSGTFYQARLSSQFNRATVGIGSDNLVALTLASQFDELCKQAIATNKPLDIGQLKQLAKEAQQAKKEQKKGIKLIVEKDSIQSLWDNYVKFHLSIGHWEKTTIATTVTNVSNLVQACPITRLEDKSKLVEWFFSDPNRSPNISKERLKTLVTAIDWNSKQGNIPRQWGIDYRDLLQSITIKKEQRSVLTDEDDIQIFSVDEITLIIEALKSDRYAARKGTHSKYGNFTEFLWLTGCRPSEAVALKWKNVDLKKGVIKFQEGEVQIGNKTIKKDGTKTKPIRYFPINDELRTLLNSIPPSASYVFQHEGKPINQKVFRELWARLLIKMGLKHRRPYQIRHSMISYHANNNYNLSKLSEIVGNSSEVITSNYLYLDIDKMELPTIK